uniref:Uncharacterized protein n=1 Tax=Steinernema glaseri TaxID=37863 RepID=A0A1I8A623_9BILA
MSHGRTTISVDLNDIVVLSSYGFITKGKKPAEFKAHGIAGGLNISEPQFLSSTRIRTEANRISSFDASNGHQRGTRLRRALSTTKAMTEKDKREKTIHMRFAQENRTLQAEKPVRNKKAPRFKEGEPKNGMLLSSAESSFRVRLCKTFFTTSRDVVAFVFAAKLSHKTNVFPAAEP